MASWFDGLLGAVYRSGVRMVLGSGLNFTDGLSAAYNSVTKLIDVGIGDAEIDPTHLAPEAAGDHSGVKISGVFLIELAFAAGTPGTPDDVTIFAADAPFAFAIKDVWVDLTTGIAASTGRLRPTTGGAGAPLTGTIDTSTSDTRPRDPDTVTNHDVAAGGSLYWRRSDRGIAGTVFILCTRL